MAEIEKLGKFERINLGGTGTMYLVHGKTKDYIYKPAQSKVDKNPEPFRGIVQECAYELQNIINPESAIVCKYVNTSEMCGSVQEKIDVSRRAPNYHKMQIDDRIDELQTSEIEQFMREFVTDYLLYNYDSHGRNFITDKNGVIRGVDKEQSFRFMNEEEAQTPSIDYSPNTLMYDETEPIYNTIFRAYRDGRINIDFSVISKYMDRAESVSEERYREIFAPYCEACSEAFGENAQAKLDHIVERRVHMRENIEGFFKKLTDERKDNMGSGKGK